MNQLSVNYILDAVEEARDYIGLLEHQETINHTIVQHSLDALEQIFTTYKKEHHYGT
tara:strand:- start:84 stop:254 length:171 start_codon:yes stop_codon:yes gene_type:complete